MEEISNSSEETINAVSQNIEKSLDWVNVYSKVILCNQDVQNMLKATSESDKLVHSRKYYRFINDITVNFPEIAGIYVVDNYGEFYFKDRTDGYLSPRKQEIEESISFKDEWFMDVEQAKGKSIFEVKRAKLSFGNGEELFFSCARIINDINSQKPIGIIVIDFKSSMIEHAVEGLDVNASRAYALYDENDNLIISAGGSEDVKMDTDNHIYHGLSNIGLGNWRFEYIVHNSAFYKETKKISIFVLSVIILNGILLSFGAAVISSRITSPISKLTEAMKNIDFDNMEKVSLKTSIPEFNVLKDGYNKMLKKTDQLLKSIIVEQRQKRKAELEALQAQIKPHFLYNTIDSINALALMKDYVKIHRLSTALGQFYRTSLSGGSEVIRIGDEIELVENYLSIQQIRYRSKFSVEYDIEESVLDEPILKLILQPFVENALYHGIKPKKGDGTISILGYKHIDSIYLEIKDDGVGMDNPLDLVTNSEKRKSFGIRATIERLQIFAGVQDVIKVESEVGKGTKITLKIPCERSNLYGKFEEANDS